MFSCPIELPGAIVPLASTAPVIVPLPPSVPAPATVVSLAMLPLTDRVPACTSVGPL